MKELLIKVLNKKCEALYNKKSPCYQRGECTGYCNTFKNLLKDLSNNYKL